MLRSMFSAVSGLRSHQTMMDVVSNNISNVNTSGYKSTRTTFQEALTQVVRGASEQDVARGGVNPMQLGLGARVASVDGVFGQGATQVTGRATDVAIQGDGFFMVQVGAETLYTRSGAFSFDNQGTLVGPGGERVMGWKEGTAVGPATVEALNFGDLSGYQDIAIAPNGNIVARDAAGDTVTLGTIALRVFANPNGLARVGSSLFAETQNSGAQDPGQASDGNRGALQGGTLEMSNVDLAQEFTNLIMAQRGFQSNSRAITASDEMLQDLVNLKR